MVTGKGIVFASKVNQYCAYDEMFRRRTEEQYKELDFILLCALQVAYRSEARAKIASSDSYHCFNLCSTMYLFQNGSNVHSEYPG